jgi:alcohol dehydrogenase, propanol-preferring
MRAMVFEQVGRPLRALERPLPTPGPGQLLLKVSACGVCRTDLHLLDGELPIASPPRILGHQIVATAQEDGRRVGVPWLAWTCGECPYCRSGRENLCPHALFTGRDIDGGMAQYTVADERFCFTIPAGYPDAQAAPLLCAGLIGYRALRMCGEARRLGLYGFGAAAHILAQLAAWQERRLFAFTRPGDATAQSFARELGEALGGIHMSDIPAFPYADLWEERTVRSVANLTRRDAEEFLELAPRVPIRTRVAVYPLEDANGALADLRAGRFTGAAVLIP